MSATGRQIYKVSLDFTVFDIISNNGIFVPVLCYDDSDTVSIPSSIVRYVQTLSNRGDSYRRMRSACFTLGLLRHFSRTNGPFLEGKLSSLIAAFLRARRTGKFDTSGETEDRQPVRRSTALRDRYFITEYCEFCIAHGQAFSLVPLITDDYGKERSLQELYRAARFSPTPKGSDLLAHIAHRRRPKGQFQVDLNEVAVSTRNNTRSKTYLRIDQIRALIRETRSAMQRMLFLEAFFGGPRLSEMLHHWRGDVLPGSLRKALFPDDDPSDLPLVVLAHPSQSTFTGSFIERRSDRLQYLNDRYGLLPRNLLRTTPMEAGWKGMEFDSPSLKLSQVFWCNSGAAREYERLYAVVRRQLYPRVEPSVLQSHPYLYINDDCSRAEFGQPLKISNARKIFQRAYARIGLDAQSYRDSSHGSRHAYKALIEQMLSSPEDRRKCLHHLSAQSQESYARESSLFGNSLRAALLPETGSFYE